MGQYTLAVCARRWSLHNKVASGIGRLDDTARSKVNTPTGLLQKT